MPRLTVVNPSNRNLPSAERSVLVLGLNFATTPSTIPKEEIFERVEPSLTGLDKTLADNIRMQISQLLRQNIRPKSNITKDERNSLKSLRADSTIYILTAGKGNATVIIDVAQYNEKILRM
ncbi:uncharacterized protein LOC117100481 [Anneissia japonica]|uniref:uncharacterized protein LOC117100481 n=1 Tax=Anneissia japonica TaxID=1529436 RepID=UPI001425A261|nr:uncharacterized protein LOC117100481 [Anneissia japonica]